MCNVYAHRWLHSATQNVTIIHLSCVYKASVKISRWFANPFLHIFNDCLITYKLHSINLMNIIILVNFFNPTTYKDYRMSSMIDFSTAVFCWSKEKINHWTSAITLLLYIPATSLLACRMISTSHIFHKKSPFFNKKTILLLRAV